jgi:hypothetical protein
MKQINVNTRLSLAAGVMLAFPAAYLIFISLLKFNIGMPFLFDTSQPLFEKLGSKEPLGFNINLLILFGPLLAMAINLFAVLKMKRASAGDYFSLAISIQKNWWNMALVIISGILLTTLFIYALGENCRYY